MERCIDLRCKTDADEVCPACGRYVGGYDDLTFSVGSSGCCIELDCHCDSCNASYVLVYHMEEAVIGEGD